MPSRRGFSAVALRTRRAAGLNSSSLLDEIEASESTCSLLPLFSGKGLADFDNLGRLGGSRDDALSSCQFSRGTNCDAPLTLLAVLPFLRAFAAVFVASSPGETSCLPIVVLLLLNINRWRDRQRTCQLNRAISVCMRFG